MATEWTKLVMDGAVGGGAGLADQLVQNRDEQKGLEERIAGRLAATEKLPLMQQWGTYLNYGVPILTVVAIAMGWVRGDMATRLATAGAQLAGRKATHTLTTGSTSKTPSAAYTQWQRNAAVAEANRIVAASQRAEHQVVGRTYEGEFNKAGTF